MVMQLETVSYELVWLTLSLVRIPYTAIFSKHTLHLPKPCEFYLYLGDEPVNALKLNVSSQRNPTTKDFDRYKIWFLFKAVLRKKCENWVGHSDRWPEQLFELLQLLFMGQTCEEDE